MDKGWWLVVKGQGYAYYRGYRPLAFCLAFAFFHLFFMTFAGCHKAARSFSRGRGTHVIHTCMNMYSYVIHTCMSTCDTYMYEHVFTCDTYMYEHVFICDTYMYEHMWYIHVWTCIHIWYIHVWTHVIHTCMNMYSYFIYSISAVVKMILTTWHEFWYFFWGDLQGATRSFSRSGGANIVLGACHRDFPV